MRDEEDIKETGLLYAGMAANRNNRQESIIACAAIASALQWVLGIETQDTKDIEFVKNREREKIKERMPKKEYDNILKEFYE